MKTFPQKYIQILGHLLQLHTYREDCYLFSKILIFQHQKQTRRKLYNKLMRLEQHRKVVEDGLLACIDGHVLIDQGFRLGLFAFTGKIYKTIKKFHLKMITFCPKLSQLISTANLLQQLRMVSIQMLNQNHTLRHFIHQFISRTRKRFNQQISAAIVSSNATSKYYQCFSKQDQFKNDRYLTLVQLTQSQLFIKLHQIVTTKLAKLADYLMINNPTKYQYINHYVGVMDICEQNLNNNAFYPQSHFTFTSSFKEEGFCEFILSKWSRMMKDMRNKNGQNGKYIQKFIQKYRQHLSKNVKLASSKSVQMKLNRSQLVYIHNNMKIYNMAQQLKIPKQVIQDQILKTVSLYDKENMNIQIKSNLYKIKNNRQQKRWFTLRPLTENKQCIHQTIVQMKLEQKNTISKALRIRKKKIMFLHREQGGTIVCKEDKNKFVLFIT